MAALFAIGFIAISARYVNLSSTACHFGAYRVDFVAPWFLPTNFGAILVNKTRDTTENISSHFLPVGAFFAPKTDSTAIVNASYVSVR